MDVVYTCSHPSCQTCRHFPHGDRMTCNACIHNYPSDLTCNWTMRDLVFDRSTKLPRHDTACTCSTCQRTREANE